MGEGEQARAPEGGGEEQSQGSRGRVRRKGHRSDWEGGVTVPTAQGFSRAGSDWDKILWEQGGREEMSLVIGSS